MAKTTYYRRKDAGRCPMCGGERTEVAFVQCVDCRQRAKKRDTPAPWDRPDGEPYIPTEEEIVAGAAEEQAKWTEKQERQRRGASNAPVEFPVIRVI